jgi:hypothetical protein
MLEILLLGAATCAIIFLIILWTESTISKDDEFVGVKDWHNFQTAMKGKK